MWGGRGGGGAGRGALQKTFLIKNKTHQKNAVEEKNIYGLMPGFKNVIGKETGWRIFKYE